VKDAGRLGGNIETVADLLQVDFARI